MISCEEFIQSRGVDVVIAAPQPAREAIPSSVGRSRAERGIARHLATGRMPVPPGIQ
jgi:hypothetical protein